MVDNNHIDPSAALSQDVRYLGNILGEIIQEQQGDAAFELVEKVRTAAKARRTGDEAAAQSLTETIAGLDLEQKRVLIKAFGNYFQLINIAEDQQRIRVLRQREAKGDLRETIDRAITDLKAAGHSAEDMRALLEKLSVRLVLTAHPSEAKRQEMMVKITDIADMMAIRERQTLLPREEAHYKAAIMRRVEQLWQTRPTRHARATVADEVEFGLFFISKVIMEIAVDLTKDLRASLNLHYPDADWSDLPTILRFASWIGGDRDGNPNVTPAVTLQTLRALRDTATQIYRADVDYLHARLTQSTDEITVDESLQHTMQDQSEADRFPSEVYRQQLQRIGDLLDQDHYRSGEDLLADLLPLYRSLMANHGAHSAGGTLMRLITKVRSFGLHLVPLDVREDARHHASAVAELFKHYRICEDFASLTESEKQELLTREISNPRPLFPIEPAFSEITNRVIATWRMVAKAHHLYGPAVIDSYIASMSQEASDVLTMLLFASEVGIADDIDIVPLFETVDDLKHAPEVMTLLFANDEYAPHLKTRGQHQQIMIGYSDSNKDGGYIASNWNLYEAQQTLAEACTQHGITLELFHGRGGSIGRGGGPTNRAILSQPPESMQGRIKITEQGEVIAYRYSNLDIARRHLHQVLNAAIVATGHGTQIDIADAWLDIMRELSETSRVAYRQFVYENDGFLAYWQQATPINELARMPIGSRPAKRKKGGFEAIRAIPWVFSWMQSRAIIPSWFGVGHALESYCNQASSNLTTLQTMYQKWSFFHALIDNVQLDVAKADMGIAELYADLVEDTALRERIFGQIINEHKRTNDMICKIIQQDALLDKAPVLKRSIERRNPYVDPLNFIQVRLLRELRTMPPDADDHERVLQAVLSTVNGIAAGMKTTG